MSPQTQTDPRRSETDSAKITQETNPQEDPDGHQDPDRVDESYQPKGIDLGSFLMLPRLEIGEQFNTNVFAQADDAKADFITRIAPEVALRSRFARHELNLLARVEQYLYATYDSDNHLDAQIQADGRYDISREWELNGYLSLFQNHEDRGSPDDSGGEEPTPARGFSAGVGSKLKEGPYTVEGGLSVLRNDFEDVPSSLGTDINNDDRDRTEVGARLRGAYEMFPGYAAIAQVTGNRRQYDSTADDLGFNRSSHGFRAEAGVGIDVSELIRGDFLAGYLHQDYDDQDLEDASGLALKAAFNWTPSRMTVVVPSLERSVLETTTDEASAMVRTSLNMLVRHELRRNIVLTGIASVAYDEYVGIDQTTWTYEGMARGIWVLAPEYYVSAELGHRRRDSADGTLDYDQTVIGLKVGFRM